MAHTELDVRERRLIGDLMVAKASVSTIAARLDRHRSTIYQEIKRNRSEDDELPDLSDSGSVTSACWLRGQHLSTGSESSSVAPIFSGPPSQAWMLAGLRNRSPDGCGANGSLGRSPT